MCEKTERVIINLELQKVDLNKIVLKQYCAEKKDGKFLFLSVFPNFLKNKPKMAEINKL